MAKLHFINGPMGSQKSTRLLADAHNFEEHGGIVLVTKPAKDTKGDRKVVWRIGPTLSRVVDFLATPDMDIQAEVLRRQQALGDINAVLVDEAQFLEPEQVDQLFALAVVNAIPVLAYGLRTDFQTNLFPGSARLLALAHETRECITMCGHGGGCKHRAHLNARKIGGMFVSQGDQVAIDGEANVTYVALCSEHYLQDVGPVTATADPLTLPAQRLAV